MNTEPREEKGQKLLANRSIALLSIRMPEILPYIQEIHRRAETITPVLKEILNFRPQPHWDK